MASSHLILGGARSGKSRFALEGIASHARVAFVATARAGDGDMAARIARHRAERPRGWLTIEEPFTLGPRLASFTREVDCVIVDCVTVWVANLLLRGDPDGDILAAGAEVATLVARGLFDVILISNEVGEGVAFETPDNAAVILGADGSRVDVPHGPKELVAHGVWDAVAMRLR